MSATPADELSIAERVDASCDRFEAAFAAGERPRLEDFLSDADEPLRIQLFRELLELELELRRRGGELPQRDEYATRFPEYSSVVELAFAELSAGPSRRFAARDSSVNASAAETSRGPAQATNASLPPKEIARFQIVQLLGEGAFGAVYRARDPQLDRDVALKLPRAETLTAQERERFLREARSAAGLHHANICPVHEVGTTPDGRDYIVMAFIDGKTLSKVLQSGMKISERQIASVIRKLAQALDEAHQKGVIHRDLKPANIMINRKGEPVIMDFGLARRSSSDDPQLSHSGQIMGTPAYMSPEQARGDMKAIGPATDIYSLGVVLYEMLCGQRPFTGTVTEVIGKILHVDAPPPSQFREGIDPRLQAICMKAIAKMPADRYAAMNDFAAALTDFIKAGSTTSGTPAAAATEAPAASEPVQLSEFARLVAVSANVEPKPKSAPRRSLRNSTKSQGGQRRAVPWWAYPVGAGVLGVVILLGIIFFVRSSTITQLVIIEENVADPTLTFFLDEKPLDAKKLAAPIELTTGVHILDVRKDGQSFKKYKVTAIRGQDQAAVDVAQVAPPHPNLPTSAPLSVDHSKSIVDSDRAAAEWVLSIGGRVTVAVGESVSDWILSGTPLPTESFRLHSIFTAGDGRPWQEADLRVLSGLTGIKAINFEQPIPHGDATMEVIETLTGLERLRFEDTNEITDAGLRRLAALTNLRALNLVSPRMSDATLEVLAKLPQLEDLSLGITGYGSEAGQSATRVTARGLSHLKAAEKLIHLNVQGVPVNDAVLQSLGELRQVRSLNVSSPGVIDASLRHLSGMTQLTTLILRGTGVTDAGLMHLKDLTNLTDLNLEGSPVTGSGAEHLRGLDTLHSLTLWGSPVTDAGLEKIKSLTQLTLLDVRQSKVTDAGMPHLEALAERLEVLHLIETAITDASVPHLSKLTKLRGLTLDGTQVTPAGLRLLKQVLPNCRLIPEPSAALEN